MDLPNVYWTFNTPLATIIGLASNVSETEGEFHQDQIDWFRGELAAADPNLALIVAVHHPAFSGDQEHSGSSEVERMLFAGFTAAQRFPDLVLSGHVHNYQRFTMKTVNGQKQIQIPFVVAGSGGYSNPRPLKPKVGLPLDLGNGMTLDGCDFDRNFGYLRIEVSKTEIVGIYRSAPFVPGPDDAGNEVERFRVDLSAKTVATI
jgi:hypothetical protein